MIITIQHNEKEREYEGESCVFAIESGEKASGALIGDRVECMYLLLRLIEDYFEQGDFFEKITFILMIMTIIKCAESEEEAC